MTQTGIQVAEAEGRAAAAAADAERAVGELAEVRAAADAAAAAHAQAQALAAEKSARLARIEGVQPDSLQAHLNLFNCSVYTSTSVCCTNEACSRCSI